MKKTLFVEMGKFTILDGKPKGLEVAGYEDKDIMFIKGVAIEEGVNANDALFERADLHRAYNTLRGKPLKIRFVNNNPTGHGYDMNTGKFDEIVQAIGVIYDSEPQVVMPDGEIKTFWGDDIPEGGTYQIVVTMGVWQKYYPEISTRLRQLHAQGDLKFSIEAEREFEVTAQGYRRCFNILFNGLAVVKNPAFENARSLVVAELLKEGGKNKMDFEKMYTELSAKFELLVGQNALDVQAKELAEGSLKVEQGKTAELSEKVITLEGDLKSVGAERDTFKSTVEQAERTKVGAQRLEKLTKYGEVVQTADELAEMTKEQFVDVLAEAVEKFSPTGQEIAEDESKISGAYFSNEKKTKSTRKADLLALVTGLAQ